MEISEYIKKHKEDICSLLDANSGLLAKLEDHGAITFKEKSRIKSTNDTFQRSEIIIDLVCEKESYSEFIRALTESNHKHVANLILAKGDYHESDFGDDMPLKEHEISKIRRHYDYLSRHLDTSELLYLLWSNGTITCRQREYIKTRETFHEKNEAFIDTLTRCSRAAYKQTIVCLQQSNQNHIAGILATDDESTRFDFSLAKEAIDIKQAGEGIFNAISNPFSNTSLLENIRVSEMVEKKWYSAGDNYEFWVGIKVACCQLNEVKQLKQLAKSGRLQDIIESVYYEKLPNSSKIHLQLKCTSYNFENCLQNVTGSIIKLRAAFDFNPEGMSQKEKSELKSILQSKMSEENLDLTAQALSFKKGDQMQTIDLENICDDVLWWAVKHMGNEEHGYIPRKLVVIDYDTTLNQENIGSVDISDTESAKPVPSLTSMRDLPFELLDSILQKSYLLHVVIAKHVLKNKDYDAISQLASVDFFWYQSIISRKFKNEVWRILFAFYRRKDKISSVYKVDRQYLEENIRLKGLVKRLKSHDCLTDVQTASLHRKKIELGKKDRFKRFGDLISEVVKTIQVMHSIFRRCLCDTKQHLVAEVIENGGAMTKVEIKLREDETSVKTTRQNMQIVERINKIRGKMKGGSHQIEELKAKLKQDDLEILSAGLDGDVIVVWICCKTKYAPEKLHTLNKSKIIIDVLTEVVENLSFSSQKRNPAMVIPKVSIDFEQFEKAVVFFSIVARFPSRLNIKGLKEEDFVGVVGVTKLRDKIHVLLSRSSDPLCVILVYNDETPFPFQKRIDIKKIEDPKDIASIEREKSLYVLDLKRDLGRRECVWKIKVDRKEKMEKIIRWLELRVYTDVPENLSVTRDGQQLLLVCRGKDDPFWSLRIFGRGKSEKAELRHSFQLGEDIERPIQAMETSKGNFIVLHFIIKKRKEEESGSDEGRRQMKENIEEDMKEEKEEEVEEEMKEKIEEDMSEEVEEEMEEELEEETEEEMEEEMMVVSEVSGDGKTIIRSFIPNNEGEEHSLNFRRLAVDSLLRVFLADYWNDRVILLDSDLQWDGIIMLTEEEGKEGKRIRWPRGLFYDEEKEELIVGAREEVFVNNLNRK